MSLCRLFESIVVTEQPRFNLPYYSMVDRRSEPICPITNVTRQERDSRTWRSPVRIKHHKNAIQWRRNVLNGKNLQQPAGVANHPGPRTTRSGNNLSVWIQNLAGQNFESDSDALVLIHQT